LTNNKEINFEAKAIRRSGDKINDAVNLWSGAAADVHLATMPPNALGICGEPARAGYERARNDALAEMNQACTALIEVREGIYRVAEVYAGAEDATKRGAAGVGTQPPPRMAEILNPPL
jgi:hypothetical protein